MAQVPVSFILVAVRFLSCIYIIFQDSLPLADILLRLAVALICFIPLHYSAAMWQRQQNYAMPLIYYSGEKLGQNRRRGYQIATKI